MNLKYVSFWEWPFALSIISLRLIQVVIFVSSSFFVSAEQYFVIQVYSVKDHLGCFQFWIITKEKKATINTHLHISAWIKKDFSVIYVLVMW